MSGRFIHLFFWIVISGVVLLIQSCTGSSSPGKNTDAGEQASTSAGNLFTHIQPEQSGIDFENKLVETESANYYKYMYSYIGGGVAAADFNNDGLEDLFFVSNSFENKLYLNQGDLKFLDYTVKAGITKRDGFDAGVTVVDINHDGFQDIYISRGGWIQDDNRFANMLFVNNGFDGEENGVKGVSFTERAEEYGLADNNRSINASFFDYDNDGDLDMYLSNTPDFEDRAAEIIELSAIPRDPATMQQMGSDKLYQNNGNGTFTDVSVKAGILPDIGFGLNPQVGDLNHDGWLDVYVCNDFRIPDFAYINNGDGTFREGRNEILKHLSFNSMGGDIADVNNDGLMDLYTLDMNPEDYVRSKTTMGMTPVSRFEEMVDKGYHYNYMHNMLQINNGNGTFREVANMAGVANTDWSWACLLADFDLDGYNDIYVTNGVFRDVIDRDANNAILAKLRENNRKPTDADFLAFTKMLPQQKLENYLFRNKGDLTFEDVSNTWVHSAPSFSNGAVYSDLDNDGDLDLVVNNINSPADILKNHAMENQKGNYLKIQLNGPEDNVNGVGTMISLSFQDGSRQVRRLIHTRGFLSAVSDKIHFGLGAHTSVPVMEIFWQDGKTQKLTDVPGNQLLSIDYGDAVMNDQPVEEGSPILFTKVSSNFSHIDPPYNDYQLQILLPHKLSQTGPGVAKGDVNGDGLEDVYLGGGHTQAGQLLIASKSGEFVSKTIPDFTKDRQREDVGACFFDLDNDNDLDLYVVSGSYEFGNNSKLLTDRLYLNDGKGGFTKTAGIIPELASAGSVVVPADFDHDGDTDLFVGGRVISGGYPYAPMSFLLVNEDGKMTVQTDQLAPELAKIGMVTDAKWADMDGDKDLDLVVTGEWMGIEVFLNEGGKLQRSESYAALSSAKGWWNRIEIADTDGDGDLDIIAGNLGLNYKFHASAEKPLHVYTHDFDYNGTVDVFLAKYYKDREVPVRGKTCATQQMPHLAQKIPTYNDFASKDVSEILGPAVKSALHYEVNEFRSGIFLNEGGGNFRFSPFGNEVQQSLINSIVYSDLDGDGIEDLLLAGNNYMSEIETTRADAGIGIFLKGLKDGGFQPVSHHDSGFFVDTDVRNLISVSGGNGRMILAINNNDRHSVFKLGPQKML